MKSLRHSTTLHCLVYLLLITVVPCILEAQDYQSQTPLQDYLDAKAERERAKERADLEAEQAEQQAQQEAEEQARYRRAQSEARYRNQLQRQAQQQQPRAASQEQGKFRGDNPEEETKNQPQEQPQVQLSQAEQPNPKPRVRPRPPEPKPKERKLTDCKDCGDGKDHSKCKGGHCAHYEFGWKDLEFFNIGAEFLYWRLEEDGLAFADFVTLPTGTFAETSLKQLKPDFQYNPGYRVWFGFEMPCYAWDLKAIWTHISCNPTLTVVSTPPDQAVGFNPNFLLFDPFNGLIPIAGITAIGDLENKWETRVDYIDIDLSHTLLVVDQLKFCPHLGVRYLWSEQNFDVNFDGVIGLTTADTFLLKTTLRDRYWGCGVEGGLWLDWVLCPGLMLMSHVGGSIMYSKAHIHGEGEAVRPGSFKVIHYKDDIFSALPMLDYFIGFQYITCFSDGQLYVRGGWEQHVIFNTNHLTETDRGDLSLQGLSVGLGLIY